VVDDIRRTARPIPPVPFSSDVFDQLAVRQASQRDHSLGYPGLCPSRLGHGAVQYGKRIVAVIYITPTLIASSPISGSDGRVWLYRYIQVGSQSTLLGHILLVKLESYAKVRGS
jgi:hypothetical protein